MIALETVESASRRRCILSSIIKLLQSVVVRAATCLANVRTSRCRCDLCGSAGGGDSSIAVTKSFEFQSIVFVAI